MEDVTDPAFRLQCKRFGADRVYTEFVNADALVREVNSTLRKLRFAEEERPVAIQIYGREPESMRDAAQMVEQVRPDFIDLNFGCPVKKVAGKGAGAGLLRDVPKMLAITRAVVDAVHLPITAKTRLGWDHEDLLPARHEWWSQTTGEQPFIVNLAEALQDCGISELSIHGRTRAQMYSGEADWELIGAVKNNPRMHIPINGNGDVTTPERAKECFDRYGVDAIMIGRATFGCPWIFQDIRTYLDSGGSCPPVRHPLEWCIDLLKDHVDAAIAYIGDEKKGILHSRRHFANSPALKGLHDFKQTRIALLQAETRNEVFTIMDQIVNQWG
ncbi:MAG: tRNA-dihydrouridine synthase family protein [Paludibacteraceae bacterium]|nr:tRNA-dihydrouridine synthase family protein [Paludibacteraceae bacterium]